MTGTWLLRTTLSIKPAPPARNQHIDQSARRHQLIRDLARTRHELMASAGSPASTSPACSASTTAAFDSAAEDEPRSRAALPDFRQMPPPASAVTLGAPRR